MRRCMLGLLIVATSGLPMGHAAGDASAVGTGGRIAFRTNVTNPGIYLINPDGSGREFVPGTTFFDVSPAISPDGLHIAVSNLQDIYVLEVDGRNRRRLTNAAFGSFFFDPAWAPDGTKVAFGGDGHIQVANVDGTGFVSLADGEDPAWSPDGSRIAFVRASGSGPPEIWTMWSNGTDQVRLTAPPTSSGDTGPVWSPDGDRIAFERSGDIFVMNADGTEQSNLTPGRPGVSDVQPSWSPDGSSIAFASDRLGGPHYQLFVMDATGDDQHRLTDNPFDDAQPSWGNLPFALPSCGTGGPGGPTTLNPGRYESGLASAAVHGVVEPMLPDPALRSVVHEANCDVLVTVGL